MSSPRRPSSGAATALPAALAAIAGCAVLVLASPQASAQPAGCVSVEVHHVVPQQGFLMLAAYADADSYAKKPAHQLRVPAPDATQASLALCGVSAAALAIMLFQDLDGDGRMARNPLGVPTEPWGSSGRSGVFGPSWELGRVTLDGQPIVVRMSR